MSDPLGPLAELPGTWTGHGFNAIWRPNHGAGSDRFLELNLTTDKIVFTKINGPIPNRGFEMPDINMFGVTYMQQISETQSGAGLHIEPGIWAVVPPTSAPHVPATVVRMASIPHGTTILAQGDAGFASGGTAAIPDNNIFPFFFGQSPPGNSSADFNNAVANFPEIDLNRPTPFRHKSPGVTQAIVTNPNHFIKAALVGTVMKHRTQLHVATDHNLTALGGGASNTAFLAGDSATTSNAKTSRVEARFWIETMSDPGHPDTLQLQYTQLVILDFNQIHWPHVTVATLRKQ